MNKVAIITDTHIGVRNNNSVLAHHMKRFYNEQFFPTLESRGIDTILHLGDLVDYRTSINFVALKFLNDEYIDKVEQGKYKHISVLGNHDVYYKSTNSVDAVRQLYGDKSWMRIIGDSPVTVNVKGRDVLFVPWITKDNKDKSMKTIRSSSADVVMGHLELAGFPMYRGIVSEHGDDPSDYQKFDLVLSGHYHHKSNTRNIHYLGAPYEMNWSDWDDPRGFHILDMDTLELEFIENPVKAFKRIDYDDSDWTLDTVTEIDYDEYKNCFVKIVVKKKTNPLLLDRLEDSLLEEGAHDVKIIENYSVVEEILEDSVDEAESTIDIIHSCVKSSVEDDIQHDVFKYILALYEEEMASC